ncbi:hypothetical protein HYR99_22125 [Candidatus Poribacteria bacterium]|nr:hypothetical protein [Candidatus Poribacteria bacterium]
MAHTLACHNLPVMGRFEPVTDFEELATFVTQNPTPIIHAERNPIWRLESVAARLIEAIAIAAHEPIEDAGWKILAQIILEHAEYMSSRSLPHGDSPALHGWRKRSKRPEVCPPNLTSSSPSMRRLIWRLRSSSPFSAKRWNDTRQRCIVTSGGG